MSTPAEAQRRRSHLVDLTPLRHSPAFARLWAGGTISGIGAQLTIVAVGLHVYELTSSTFAVSLVGVFALVPMIVFGLYGGMLADTFDRRRLLLVAAIVAWSSTTALCVVAFTGVRELWVLYLITTVNAVSATVISTVRSAVTPRLLPRELLPAASAMQGIGFGVMLTVGPALAGVLVAWVGFGGTYLVDVVLFLSSFLGILTLPRLRPEGEVQRPGLESLRYGFSFLRRAPNIRMSFIVDIVAMTFGQPRVLFPAVGAVLLGGGPVTVGVLSAASAVGTLLCGLFSGRFGSVRWHGRAIRTAIVIYGAFVAGFGVLLAVVALGWFGASPGSIDAPNLPEIAIASLLLAGMGASDEVSAVFRSTMLQTAVPDNMRGRLQGVFTVVVTGGPRIGDLYVGLVAALGALWLPPLLGGLLIMALLTLLTRLQRGFLRYDARDPRP